MDSLDLLDVSRAERPPATRRRHYAHFAYVLIAAQVGYQGALGVVSLSPTGATVVFALWLGINFRLVNLYYSAQRPIAVPRRSTISRLTGVSLDGILADRRSQSGELAKRQAVRAQLQLLIGVGLALSTTMSIVDRYRILPSSSLVWGFSGFLLFVYVIVGRTMVAVKGFGLVDPDSVDARPAPRPAIDVDPLAKARRRVALASRVASVFGMSLSMSVVAHLVGELFVVRSQLGFWMLLALLFVVLMPMARLIDRLLRAGVHYLFWSIVVLTVVTTALIVLDLQPEFLDFSTGQLSDLDRWLVDLSTLSALWTSTSIPLDPLSLAIGFPLAVLAFVQSPRIKWQLGDRGDRVRWAGILLCGTTLFLATISILNQIEVPDIGYGPILVAGLLLWAGSLWRRGTGGASTEGRSKTPTHLIFNRGRPPYGHRLIDRSTRGVATLIGEVVLATGLVALSSNLGQSLLNSTMESAQTTLSAVALVLVTLGIIAIYNGLLAGMASVSYRAGAYRRRLALPSAAFLTELSEGPEVVLLRAFKDDKIRMIQTVDSPFSSALQSERFEVMLASSLWRYGSIVALGQPGEEIPPLGSIREYVAEGQWQNTIKARIQAAKLVVVVVGPAKSLEEASDGLAWELHHLLKGDGFGKTLVLFPPVTAEEHSGRWRSLRLVFDEADRGVRWPVESSLPAIAAFLEKDRSLTWFHALGRTEHHYSATLLLAAEHANLVEKGGTSGVRW